MWRATSTAALAWFASSGTAAACTICHSPTAMGVRHQVLEHDFLSNAAAVAAPLPILFAAIFLAARDPRPKRPDHGR